MDRYNKLNEYLNRVFIMLNKNDQFLLSNLLVFDSFCQELSNSLSEMDINYDSKENDLSYFDILKLTREIINSIDSKYVAIFDKALMDGTIDLSYENDYDYSHVALINQDTKLINVNRCFNYSDVVGLIHEFFHFTNLQNENSINQYILTEFISIYFETYTINYLKNKGISHDELLPNERIKDLINCVNSYFSYAPILIAYDNFGIINNQTLEWLNKYFFPYDKDEFDEDVDDLLNYFEMQEANYYNSLSIQDSINVDVLDYQISESIISDYRYLLGTILTFYAINHCNMKDIVDLNDNINDKYAEMDVIELIEKIGIKLDEEFIITSIENIKKFIIDNNKVR